MKRLCLSSLVLLLILLSASPVQAKTSIKCMKNNSARIRWTYKGKEKTQKAKYCFSHKTEYLLNYSCHLKGKCEALQAKKVKFQSRYLAGTMGNPLFNYCKKLGGQGQFLEYYDGKEWQPASVCRFKDKSYVSLAYLVRPKLPKR